MSKLSARCRASLVALALLTASLTANQTTPGGHAYAAPAATFVVINVAVNDATQPEPVAGTTQMLFTVMLSTPALAGGLTVNYATADGGGNPATGGASCDGATDYITTSGTLTFAPDAQVQTVAVNVCADASTESDETLLLNLSDASAGNIADALITDGQAVGTITQPGPSLLINDAKQTEPASGTRNMVFTVALTSPALGNIAVDFATEDEPAGTGKATAGTCGSGGDYTATSGQVAFTAGQQVKTINVPICADATVEPDETFLVRLSNAVGAPLFNGQPTMTATGTITAANPAGTLLISELRTRGSAGANDDFVELYNNTATPLNVNGYGVFKMGAGCSGTPVLVGTLPNVSIPPRGHYLLVGSAYSLANYGGTGAAAGDLVLTADIEDDANVAVFSTAAVADISSTNRLDAVGFGTNTGGVCDLTREGSTLAPVGAMNIEYSYFRKECDYVQNSGCSAAGNPKDTNENATDFLFADTAMTNITGITRRLGAPGPDNLNSPIRRDDSGVLVMLLDGTKSTAAVPNRDRDFINAGPTAPNGTLYVRRRIQNTTGSTVTRLRFRVIEVTTGPTPPVGTADMRMRTSSAVTLSGIQDTATCAATGTPATVPCQVTAQAMTLETPPAQPNGGGYNSTLSVSIPGGLANNASINVNFALGVVQGGTFRHFFTVEALP